MNDAAPRSSWKKLHHTLPNPCGPLTGLPWPSAAACCISAVAIAFSGTLYWTLQLQLRRQRVTAAQPHKSFCCPDALDELLPLSNRSTVNPCLDLHGFVCRRQGAKGVPRSNVFRRAYANVLLDWAALFYGSSNGGHLDRHFNMVKRIYRSCVLTMSEVGEAERQADIFLHQWGDVWKTIRDNPTRQDLMQLVLILALTYNISTVLDVKLTLAFDGRTLGVTSNVVRMIITPGPDLCSFFQDNPTFCHESSAAMLRWLKEYVAFRIDEVGVAEIIELQSVLRLIRTSAGGQTTPKTINEVAGAIANTTGEILKEQIHQAIPTGIQLSEIDEIETSEPAVLSKLMEHFLRPDRRKTALALLMLQSFAFLAHRVFPTNTSLRSIQQLLVDCDLHVKSFGQLWNLAITKAVDNSRRRVEAETIISQIRTAVLRRMQTSFFQSYRSTATSTLQQLHLYYPKNTVPRSAALPNISDNFFANAFRARKYEQSAHLELVATRKMSLSTARLGSELGYFPHENALFISHSSLAPPVFSRDDERFINYARFGALIAGEIYGSILAGTEPEHAKNETNSGFQLNGQRSCFEKLYFGHKESMTSTAILDRALSLSHGLETVWEIAKGDVWGHRVALQQHGEVVTWAQVFFLRYCATWCGFYDSDNWNRWNCNVPVRNLMAFHSAFGCPKPDERCPP